MSESVRVRALSKKEMAYAIFLKSEAGQQITSWGCQISIIGSTNHGYVERENVESGVRLVYLGDGQYFYDGPPLPLAQGGYTSQVLVSVSFALQYIRVAAESLGINVFRFSDSLMYFDGTYQEAVYKAFAYIDRTVHQSHTNSFFLSRLFGGGIPNWNSHESNQILRETCKILAMASK